MSVSGKSSSQGLDHLCGEKVSKSRCRRAACLRPEFLPASRLVWRGEAVTSWSQPPREDVEGSKEPVNSWPWGHQV